MLPDADARNLVCNSLLMTFVIFWLADDHLFFSLV